MKKKLGFTLAEVLITLGIIGVVAALTAPALVQNAGTAQIGPKLAKAVSTFEVANQNLLTDMEANSLKSVVSGVDANKASKTYAEAFSKYMKMTLFEEGSHKYGTSGTEAKVTKYDGSVSTDVGFNAPMDQDGSVKYLSKDGFLYSIFMAANSVDRDKALHKQVTGFMTIDINGLAKPNRFGKDVFFFFIMQDGSLLACGSSGWKELMGGNYWDEGSDLCNENTVTSGYTCAGSIFENNLKVIYE